MSTPCAHHGSCLSKAYEHALRNERSWRIRWQILAIGTAVGMVLDGLIHIGVLG